MGFGNPTDSTRPFTSTSTRSSRTNDPRSNRHVLGIDPDSFDIEIRPVLDPDLDQLVSAAAHARDTAAAHARDTATTARAHATDALRQLLETASTEGYTVRDIAEIAGVSHQYAAKLTNR